MKRLSIDLETFSSNDLKRGGLYKYVEATDFEILLFAYSIDGSPVEVIDMVESMGEIPEHILTALTNPAVEKWAYNMMFERVVLNRYFNIQIPIESCFCTMVKSALCGLPFGLGNVANVLKLETKKDLSGSALIRYFAIPCKPTKTNDQRTRNMPWHDAEKWQKFIDYCRIDVEVEMEIAKKIEFFTTKESEQRVWWLDQKINDRGIELDPVLVKNAIEIDTNYRERLLAEATELTGLSNVNSGAQLKEWLSIEIDEAVTSLKKDAIPQMIKDADSEVVKRVLGIRQEISKTSVKKYTAMVNCMCADNRARGLFQYVGANRTLRFSGRLIQLQNLPQNHLYDLDYARQLVLTNEADELEMMFGNVPDTLSQLIRTAIIAGKGKEFFVSDFASIELIVSAWLSGEQWVIDEYKGARKIYEHAAARMLKKSVGDVTKPERQKGKIGTLACQYGGGGNAIIKMGGLNMGITEEEAPDIAIQWRTANPNTVRYWKILENAAIACVKERRTVKVKPGVSFFIEKGILFMGLPSGGKLSYFRPTIKPGKFDQDTLFYEGLSQTAKKWEAMSTWGGKLYENLCQAVARDCLTDTMLKLDDLGYKIVCHVHDEVVIENNGQHTLEELNKIMSEGMSWAPDMPIASDGFKSPYYKK